MDAVSLQSVIEKAWDGRDGITAATKGEVRDAVEAALEALDSGGPGSPRRPPAAGRYTSG